MKDVCINTQFDHFSGRTPNCGNRGVHGCDSVSFVARGVVASRDVRPATRVAGVRVSQGWPKGQAQDCNHNCNHQTKSKTASAKRNYPQKKLGPLTHVLAAQFQSASRGLGATGPGEGKKQWGLRALLFGSSNV